MRMDEMTTRRTIENQKPQVTLNGVQVSQEQFNERVKELKSNQRIAESGNNQFVVIERLFD